MFSDRLTLSQLRGRFSKPSKREYFNVVNLCAAVARMKASNKLYAIKLARARRTPNLVQQKITGSFPKEVCDVIWLFLGGEPVNTIVTDDLINNWKY